MLVNILRHRMSPSRRKGSRLIWTYFGGGNNKMASVSSFITVVLVLSSINLQLVSVNGQGHDVQEYPVSLRYQGNFLNTEFKPSPLLETYFEREQTHPTHGHGHLEDAGSMQNDFLDLFDWRKPMPTTTIVNTFLDNENELPFLREISRVCPRKDFFFGLNPRHMQAVMRLKEVIMEQRSPEDAIKMAAGLRDRSEINPHAWIRAVYGSTIHRRDMQGLRKPPIVEVMPSMFIPNEVMSIVKRSINNPAHSRRCVLVDGSVGRDNGVENLLWYWREDVMMNAHHWYWHLAYPINGERGRQDREGELFYFMHHTMLARYHCERLSVGLPPVRPFNLQPGSRIPFGYNPHLHDGNSEISWSARPPGVPVQDIMSNRLPNAPFFVSVRNRTIQLNRIFEGISLGHMIDSYGQPVYLDTDEGINILGNTVEANAYTINPEYYGYHGIHNNGHNIISLSLDPRDELGLPPGVMGEASTAMRDVMFYPYHEFIDNIFNRYKNTLQPYQLTQGDWPLLVHGVDIHSIKVQSNNLPANVLHTFWSSRRYDLSRGLDFNRSFVRGPLWACHQHLDHQDFEYELKIERKNYANHAKTVTVRLFMGPRYDLKGRRYNLEEERHFMFILDTFTVPLKVGMNTIRRRSIDTPLTIDFPRSLRELSKDDDNTMPFCGCGWPHHLLIPKGTREGLSFDIFAIVTDSEQDYVEPERRDPQSCRPAYVFCGVMGDKYPDARPMGYPFDRRLFVSEHSQDGHGPAFLEHLVREVPNTAFAHIKVIHFDELRNLGPGHVETFSLDEGGDDSSQFLDEGKSAFSTDGPFTSHSPSVIHIDGSTNALTSVSPVHHPRLVTSPISLLDDSLDHEHHHHPGPPPPPPPPGPPPPGPPPRTILNLRLRHPDDGRSSTEIIHDNGPNYHSGSSVSESNGLEEYHPSDPLRVQEEIRNAIDAVHPPPPPPPPIGIPQAHPHLQVRYSEEHDSLPPQKRRYRSAFRSSFRSLLKSFSPLGPIGGPPKSVLALIG